MKPKLKPEVLPAVIGPEDPLKDELKGYALVELFGHQRIVGFLSQQVVGVGVLLRVDVPDLLKDSKTIRKGFTRYFGLGAIYGITPIDEATVKALLPNIDGTPGEARVLTQRSYQRDEDDDPFR